MDRANGAESQHAQVRKRENIEMGVLTPAEQILGGFAAVARHFAHVAQVKLILHGLFLLNLQAHAGTNVIFESRASKVSCISFQKSRQSEKSVSTHGCRLCHRECDTSNTLASAAHCPSKFRTAALEFHETVTTDLLIEDVKLKQYMHALNILFIMVSIFF